MSLNTTLCPLLPDVVLNEMNPNAYQTATIALG
jgi:hypothetical protein